MGSYTVDEDEDDYYLEDDPPMIKLLIEGFTVEHTGMIDCRTRFGLSIS